jgi:hypothetical protein
MDQNVKTNVLYWVPFLILLLNGFLLFACLEADQVVGAAQARAGGKVIGYELFPGHTEVDGYYSPPGGTPGRRFRGELLYWFSAPFVLVPWIGLSIGGALVFARCTPAPKVLRYVPVAMVAGSLLVVLLCWDSIDMISLHFE